MPARWQVFHLSQLARYDELPLTNVPLFAEEEFRACLLGFLPGQELPGTCTRMSMKSSTCCTGRVQYTWTAQL